MSDQDSRRSEAPIHPNGGPNSLEEGQEESDHSFRQSANLLLREIDELLQNPMDISPSRTLMRLNSLLFQNIVTSIQSPNLSPTNASLGDDLIRFHFPPNATIQRRHIDPHRRFSSEEYSFAKDEFKQMCETDQARAADISTRILNVMIDFYYDHNCDEWPSQMEIVNLIKEEPCGCIFLQLYDSSIQQSCLQLLPTDQVDDLLYYYIFSEARLPTCDELNPIIEYYTLHDSFPTLIELQQYVVNRLAFYTNPEEYHQRDKIHVPVAHPERIPVLIHRGECIGCGICQSDISESQSKIVLKGCGHSFHAHLEDCLETASIYTWFQKESVCPMCKSTVSVTSSTDELSP